MEEVLVTIMVVCVGFHAACYIVGGAVHCLAGVIRAIKGDGR